MKLKTSALIAVTMAAAAIPWASTLRAAPPTTQAAAPAAVGLDSLDDQRLLSELSDRGMNDLLQRAFTEDKTPVDKQNVIKSLASLNQLTHNIDKLSFLQRQQAAANIAAQIDTLLATLKNNPDPNTLIKLAGLITANGLDREVAILEYWGETDTEKAKLKPLADATVKLYDQAGKTAKTQADIIANQIKSPNDPNADKWQAMSDLAAGSDYQKLKANYALALALDKKDPARAKLIDEALNADTGLPRWDSADSGIQPMVKFTMAKLNLLKGDYPTANTQMNATLTLLDGLIKTEQADSKTPPALLAMQKGMEFEIHCFKVVSALEQEDIATSEATLKDAQTDQQTNFALDKSDMATLELLNYRILAMKADKAAPGAEQDSANATAVAALGQLVKEFPELRGVIFAQLIARLPANPDFSKIDTVMLEALVREGEQEVVTKQPQDVLDKPKLQRALSAAQEIIKRGDAGNIDAAVTAEASLLQGFFQEYLGDKLGAVHSLLDYVRKHASDPHAKGEFALNHAQGIIVDLQKNSPVDSHGNMDPYIELAQNDFMSIAINPPFNRLVFALEYAVHLRRQGKWVEAEKYYHMVPATDTPANQLSARYGEMLCLIGQLGDEKITAELRTQLVDEIQTLVPAIRSLAAGIIQNSPSATEKTAARSTLAQTVLDAADITRRGQQNPQGVLDLLNKFEDTVQGLPEAKTLLNEALQARVESYMQLGQTNEATKSLVQFLDSAGANEGADTMFTLLGTLNTDLEQSQAQEETARASNDAAALAAASKRVRQIADNRAVLSGFLVNWAESNSNPKTKASIYRYRTFAADTLRLSAKLETDPDIRAKHLADALADYKKLLTADNVALYQAGLPANTPATARNYTDPAVTLGIGLIDYDLGDWQGVKATLGVLVRDQKLGEDTDQSWEASYKVLDSMQKLAKSGDPKTTEKDVQQSLKILYVIWRDETGGKKYHEKFEALRKEILPDWQVPPPVPAN